MVRCFPFPADFPSFFFCTFCVVEYRCLGASTVDAQRGCIVHELQVSVCSCALCVCFYPVYDQEQPRGSAYCYLQLYMKTLFYSTGRCPPSSEGEKMIPFA